MYDYLVPGDYFGSWHGFDRPWPEHHDYFFDGVHYRARTLYRLPDGYAALHLGPRVDYGSEFGRLTRRWHRTSRKQRWNGA